MKRIKPEELPSILTEEIIKTLVAMAREFPKKTFDWANVSEELEKRGQRRIILDRVTQEQQAEEKARKAAMSEEDKAKEAAAWERIKNDPDPNKFYGNMGQPETPQEYKNRYGVWPPGYDQETGERLPSNPGPNR